MGMSDGAWNAQCSGRTVYMCVELGIQCSESTREPYESVLNWMEAKFNHSVAQGIDYNPSESTRFPEKGEIDLKTMQRVDSEVFKSTPPFKMSFKESCESTQEEPESIHMSPDF
ncbi:hypothetical protein PIB30_071471 [Stylosanthes scabra]|uniref:Uncharacterized protein n=1 Tax=Stylosanthes scabra TaxID=79078 RepID=A0ABU6UQH3_9FABA|nr:hypothetical protein [Stylosanthes scabra]